MIVVYATAAYVIIELINNVTEPLSLPNWTPTLIIVILLVGFPFAIIFSWIFDVSPKGIAKTLPSKEFPKGEKVLVPNSWRIATYASVAIIIGLIAFNIFKGKSGNRIDESLEKSIAVLPFYYYNFDPDEEDIGDAFANEIITQLYKIKGFDRIISHTSTVQYKGQNKPSISAIGEKLDVNYIIEGSLERQNEYVSIQIQIINARNDSHIWAEEFKGRWEDIFAIRANIAKNVAAELKTILTPDEIVQVEEKPTVNLKAYDFYLLGNQYRSKRTEVDYLKAIDLYESAIDLDPDFALAYVGIGTSYRSLFWSANWLPEEVYEQARYAVIKALEINNQLAEAHELLARILYEYDWNLKEGERELRIAIDLNPNLASAYAWIGDIQLITGQYDESHESFKTAIRLDPNSSTHYNYFGFSYYLIDQVDSAINLLQYRVNIDPNNTGSQYWLGIVYLEIGEYLKAIRKFEKLVNVNRINGRYHMYLGISYAKAGMLDEARQQLEVFDTLEKESRSVSFGRAVLLAELGESDASLYWLQRSIDERSQGVFYIKSVKVLFSTMRSDPRLIEMLDKVYSNNK